MKNYLDYRDSAKTILVQGWTKRLIEQKNSPKPDTPVSLLYLQQRYHFNSVVKNITFLVNGADSIGYHMEKHWILNIKKI